MPEGKICLTGIKPTGTPHLGNYVGAIKPGLALTQGAERVLYFIADYHALTSVQEPKKFAQLTREVAATWLACGLDPEDERVVFYRQSDLPEVFELQWILACMTAKGLMNRAHAYKAAVQANRDAGQTDDDAGINMGLYSYPVLMAADILLFDADTVPVGQDQVQHIEIARDVAQHFNHTFGETLKLPAPKIEKESAVLPGLDGRKMSKSYGNTVPLFVPTAELKKLVYRVVTDSSSPTEPKDPDKSHLFALYRAFATPAQTADLASRYRTGIGWGKVKEELYQLLEATLREPRARYDELMAHPDRIDAVLAKGAARARALGAKTIQRVRKAIGVTG